MNKKRIITIAILLALAVLNTGCVEKYFYDDKNIKKKAEVKRTTNARKDAGSDTSTVECVDEIKPQENNCDRGVIPAAKEVNNISKQAEQHTFKSIRGKTINVIKRPKGYDFPEYRGKVIILEMFGKDCPHCTNQLPSIEKVRNKYRGRLEVIAIQSQDRMSKFVARDYINRHKIKYPIIEGEDAINLQRDIQETFGWTGILPYTLVIQDGIIKYINSGEVSYKDLERDISEII